MDEPRAPIPVGAASEGAEGSTFQDALYDWMERAPWLAISLAAHLLVFFVLMAVPWKELAPDDDLVLNAQVDPLPEELFEPEKPEPVEELVPIETPEPRELDSTVPEDESREAEAESITDASSDSSLENFDSKAFQNVLGIGDGGLFGGRFGRGGLGPAGGSGTERALADALDWLRAHQGADGSWDSDGFSEQCGALGSGTCDGPGDGAGDVALTGLALLAMMGSGSTPAEGEYRDSVARGIRWLRLQQDPDSGVVGDRLGHSWVYGHAIGTLALCEAYYFTHSPLLKRVVIDAVNRIEAMRNPYGVWRYDDPPTGENDTSITGWMLMCLKSARESGIDVDGDAFEATLAWLDEVSDPRSGRVGYTARGELPPRTLANEHWPAEHGESTTGVGLLLRFFAGQDPAKEPLMKKHAELIARKPPRWGPREGTTDVYYWYYGSYAMFQMGGRYWRDWNRAMKPAVLESQRRDGDAKGSWDPLDVWGYSGGRVYTTAMLALCLEVYFRYGRVIGGR